jgi:ubiquinone/menaquinone biosynthesis C-methylase UbiE
MRMGYAPSQQCRAPPLPFSIRKHHRCDAILGRIVLTIPWDKLKVSVAGTVRRFMRANQAVSATIADRLPHAKPNLHEVYTEAVGEHVRASNEGLVIDVGGGRTCPFAHYRRPGSRVKIVALDISAEELALNHDVDETRVADVAQEMPFDDSTVDLVTSSSVLEHVKDVEGFVRNASHALKPGGAFIHVFSCRYAPSALLNRFLPNWLTRRILHFVIPGSEGILGFPAYYNRCYASAVRAMLDRNGLEVIELRAGYFAADYFGFFVPVFLGVAGYELITCALNAENLAPVLLVVARKR